MPTKRSTAKAAVHSTPQKAKTAGVPEVSVIPEANCKGFFKPEANALIKEVLKNQPSNRLAAKQLKVNRSTVQRYRNRVAEGRDPITPQKRTPPPSPSTDKRVKIVESLLSEDDEITCPEIRDILEHEHGINVCRMTVFRDITEKLGMVFKEVRKVPAKFKEEGRVKFAKAELKEKGDPYYVFMDESWVNATHRNKGCWVQKGAPRPDAKCRERFVPKVNTFGLLCEDRFMTFDMPKGTGEKGGVTQEQFHKFFKQNVGPKMANLKKWAKGRPIRLMLDGAGIHGTAKLQAWAKEKGVSFIMGWPAHSPDLNPIENVFSRLKDGIGKELQIYSMKDKEKSMKRIAAKRNTVADSLAGKCHAYVKSFRSRLRLCVEKRAPIQDIDELSDNPGSAWSETLEN